MAQPPILSQQLARHWPPLWPDAHKGQRGHVLVIAGSPWMPGAAQLCLRGARRSGVGRITWLTCPTTLRHAGGGALPEVLLRPWPSEPAEWREALGGVTAAVVGPGLGGADKAREAMAALGAVPQLPVCIDADALRLLAQEPQWLTPLAAHAVLTPHPGEMAALCRQSSEAVQQAREAVAQRLADDLNTCVLLKGAQSVVAAPGRDRFVLPGPGTPALAKAGTGDVLAGLLAGILAQGLAPFAAAFVAALAHQRAGMLAAERLSVTGCAASDVAEALGDVWREEGR